MKIAINGFGRIGRAVARLVSQRGDIELVAINDLASIDMACYLLKYDSVHGRFKKPCEVVDDATLRIGEHHIAYSSIADATKLDFAAYGADAVLECSGRFLTTAAVSHHIDKGVGRVIISAVAEDDTPTYALGVNASSYKGEPIISNGSCTTNALAPIVKLIDNCFGIQKGLMTTIHSYTNGQNLLDSNHPSDLRRARAAAYNIIPTTTHAARGIYRVLPHLKGKLDGQSVRVPVADVSMLDLTLMLARSCKEEEVLELLERSIEAELAGIVDIDYNKRVSSDMLGSPYSAVVAADLIQIIGGDMLKLMIWYDNEYGYANRLVEMAHYIHHKR